MKIATTTMELSHDYPGQHLERVKKIHEAGFNHIDLSFFLEARPDSAFLRDASWSNSTGGTSMCRSMRSRRGPETLLR
jgi:hypothetical protein